MAWKKIIVSGSTAALGTLTVDNSVEASVISGSTISGSFVGNGSGLTNLTVAQSSTVIENFTSQTTVTVIHNFESNNVLATVYDSDGYQIIPASVRSNQDDRVVITFEESTSGKIIVGKGGHIVSGSIPFTNILSKPTLFSGSAQVQINDTTGTLTTLGTVTTGDVSAILPSGTVSGSSIASSAQGEVALTTNGTAASAIDLGLQTSDSPTFASLTLTGDLTVQGTTTSIQTSNLLVEDKFILLNSGSANPDEGGIIIDEGSGQGHAYVYDSNATRFGYTGSLAFNTSSVVPDAFAAAVVDIDAGHVDKAEYQKNGNIKIDSGVIFIYA